MTANPMRNFVPENRYGNKLSRSSGNARGAYVVGIDRLSSAGPGIDQAFRESRIETMPLQSAAEAVARMRSGQARFRIVLTMMEEHDAHQ